MAAGDRLARFRGNEPRPQFRRLCDLADANELQVLLWWSRHTGRLTLQVTDGAQGASGVVCPQAGELDDAAFDVIGQLAEAGIR